MSDDDIPLEELMDGLDLDRDPSGMDLDDRNGDSELIGGDIVNWRTLTPDQAPEAWAKLHEWVTWLCGRYGVENTIVPDCWWRHGSLVEELSALHSAWLASFDETDSGYGPIGWHERWAIAKERLRKNYSGACLNGHKLPSTRLMPAPYDDPAWHDWIRAPHEL